MVEGLLDFLDEWRRLNGDITEEEPAGRADIAKGTFTGWRRGAQPSVRVIRKLALATEVPEGELFALAGYGGGEEERDTEDISATERLWLQMLRDLNRARPDLLSEATYVSILVV